MAGWTGCESDGGVLLPYNAAPGTRSPSERRAPSRQHLLIGCGLNRPNGLKVSGAVWLTPVTVECYAGAKADEAPRRFRWEEQPVEVAEVVDRWHQVESKPEWPRADYFKVRGTDQHEYLLKHDLELDAWYLGRRW